MKIFNFLISTVLFLNVSINANLIERFRSWVNDFKIEIKNDEHELVTFEKWVSNDKYIEIFNNNNNTFTLGHNQFSGMNSEDFKNYLGYSGEFQKNNLRKNYNSIDKSSLLTSINWIEKGGVTPVKDQGQCGSCWSFSTTGGLEGAYFVKYGTLLSFSEQQLVDCDNFKNGGKDHGCNGGLMDNAFTWVGKNGGLCLESSYPYVSGVTETDGTCQKTCEINTKSKVQSFIDVEPNSDSSMMSALSINPVSIAIEADQKEFQLYKSGVFTASCGTNLDHGVLTVGYGTMDNKDYYIVKNSWGNTWGVNGYIYLGRGSEYNNGAGQCGMLMEGSYPVL